MNGSNMKVIETMRLTPNQFMQIVKIGEQYLAIAVSKDQVTVLTKLDEAEINLGENNNTVTDFGSVFKQFKNAFPVKGGAEETSEEDEE